MTIADQTIGEFVESVASESVPPGGGAAAAVCGAYGAALAEMVCNLTIGKDDYAEVEDEMAGARDELAEHRKRLLELADEDSAAIRELFDAYGLSSGDERDEAIQRATKRATEVPMETAEACLDVLEHLRMITLEGNQNALADGGIGAYLTRSALQASLFTVRSNLGTIDDEEFVGEMKGRADEVERTADEALEQVEANVDDVL